MWEQNQLGAWEQSFQDENYLDKVSRVWGSVFERAGKSLLGVVQQADPLTNKLDEFQQSPDGQMAMEMMQAATPQGAALGLISKTADAAIERFNLPPETALLPLLATLAIGGGKKPTKNQLQMFSRIATNPKSLAAKYPHLANKAELWTRKGYTQLGKTGNIKGFGRFIDDDGGVWYLKRNQSAGQPASLSMRQMSKKRSYAITRSSNEKADIPAIRKALEKHGHGDKLEKLLKLRSKDLANLQKQIKAQPGMTLGHIKSVGNRGIHVAENAIIEPAGINYSTSNKKDILDSILRKRGVPITWEEWVNMKLPELLK